MTPLPVTDDSFSRRMRDPTNYRTVARDKSILSPKNAKREKRNTRRRESEKLRSEKSLFECQSSKDTLLQDNKNSLEKAMQCETKRTVLESQPDHYHKDQTTETTKCNDKIQQCEVEKRSAANQCEKKNLDGKRRINARKIKVP